MTYLFTLFKRLTRSSRAIITFPPLSHVFIRTNTATRQLSLSVRLDNITSSRFANRATFTRATTILLNKHNMAYYSTMHNPLVWSETLQHIPGLTLLYIKLQILPNCAIYSCIIISQTPLLHSFRETHLFTIAGMPRFIHT